MSDISPTYDDEIDLLSLIKTVWDGKWKIALIIVVFFLSVYCFNIINPNKSFIATTKIKPITSFEFDKYSLFNSSLKIIEKENKELKEAEENRAKKDFNIFEITQESLLNLYIDQLL